MNKIILALSPKKSEARRLLGENYDFQCEADDENQIFKHLCNLYEKWNSNEKLELNKPELLTYVSEEHSIVEMKKAISEIEDI